MNSPENSRWLRRVTAELAASYREKGGVNIIGDRHLPSQREIVRLLEDLQGLVFPGYHGQVLPREADLELMVGARLDALSRELAAVIAQTLRFCCQSGCSCRELWEDEAPEAPDDEAFAAVSRRLTRRYLEQLPAVRDLLEQDVQAAFEGDPAATNTEEIILCYPGITAILVHRLAHPLYELGVPLLPRIMNEWAHHRSGVDIHPGARIGRSFFIDHGTGVVIGETTEIGERVKIYQGVTLGALSFSRNPDGTLVKGGKRHPTIGDRVTIYANATILGGETVIGDDAVIGGGVWITESVPAGAKVLNTR